MSRSSGPVQVAVKAITDAGSARSSRPTWTAVLPVVAVMSAAVRWPASASRTASVTSAPTLASARAVSIPMPDAPPVTIARRPVRSIPAMTSAAVDCAPNGVVMRSMVLLLAGQGVDRDLPQAGGRVGVERVGRDAVAGVDGRAGFVAVLEVPAA